MKTLVLVLTFFALQVQADRTLLLDGEKNGVQKVLYCSVDLRPVDGPKVEFEIKKITSDRFPTSYSVIVTTQGHVGFSADQQLTQNTYYGFNCTLTEKTSVCLRVNPVTGAAEKYEIKPATDIKNEFEIFKSDKKEQKSIAFGRSFECK